METSHAARLLSVCGWYLKAKSQALLLNYQLPGAIALLHQPASWCFIPEIRERERDGEKGPPVSNRQAFLVEPGLQEEKLWGGGAGIVDMGEPKITPILSEYKTLHMSLVLSGALSFSDTFSDLWAYFKAARWSWRSPLCLSAFGGFDFAHLVAVWIALITIQFMKDPCFFQRPHSTVLEKATRGVTYQESQVLEEVNNTWFNRVRKEHKCWLSLWPSIFL